MSNLKNDNGCYDMKALHSKGFPQIKVGRRILIPKKLFEEWLNNASAEQLVI